MKIEMNDAIYGFNLDYEDSYSKTSYKVIHKAFKVINENLSSIKGVKISDITDDVIIQFDKIFPKYIMVTYVDLMNADKAILDVFKYPRRESTLIIYKISWRHRGLSTFLVYYLNPELNEYIRHGSELGNILSELGIKTAIVNF